MSGLSVTWPDTVPGVPSYERVTLSRRLTRDIQLTRGWIQSGDANQPKDMHIDLQRSDGASMVTILLAGAVPTGWDYGSGGGGAQSYETLELRHAGFLTSSAASPCP